MWLKIIGDSEITLSLLRGLDIHEDKGVQKLNPHSKRHTKLVVCKLDTTK
jgi:hypothetical protein